MKVELDNGPMADRNTVVGRKVNAMVHTASVMVDRLSSENWTSVMEGQFTEHSKKAAGLETESGQVGDSEATHSVAVLWSEGLYNAKLFLKGYHQYVKGKYNSSHIQKFAKFLDKVLVFLKDVGKTPSDSLVRLQLKARFYDETSENGSPKFACLGQACAELVNGGFADLWQGEDKEGSAKPEIWLRTMVHEVWIPTTQTRETTCIPHRQTSPLVPTRFR